MNLSEKLIEATGTKVLFEIDFLGLRIPIPDVVLTMWIIMVVMVGLAIWLTRNLKPIPSKRQNIAEIIVNFINNIVKDAIGHHWRPFAPYLGTILLFLVFANTISIFNVIPGEAFKLKPPTKNINVTACMAIMSIILVLIASIRFKKFSGWLKSLVKPIPVMLPFNILEYGIKPLSLALRLYGNILGAFIIMELIYLVFPPVIPAVLSIYFDLFDGLLQAYVFVFLTSLYIGEAVE